MLNNLIRSYPLLMSGDDLQTCTEHPDFPFYSEHNQFSFFKLQKVTVLVLKFVCWEYVKQIMLTKLSQFLSCTIWYLTEVYLHLNEYNMLENFIITDTVGVAIIVKELLLQTGAITRTNHYVTEL